MWAILRTCGQVCATPTAAVIPSADWMLVMRKQYFGWGTALSKRKSVQPSVKMVSTWSSSATGPSAGVLALEMMPVNRSILPSSFIRRNSLTLASVPAASSAVMVSIWRLPRSPPWALISSAAIVWPFSDGSPSTAAALVRKVIWPTLKGLSGILPLAGSPAALTIRGPPTIPAAANPAPPTAAPGQRRAALDLAREIERRGFAGISVSSSYANMAQCTGLALATERITFATAIAPIYAQTVEEFAQAAAYTHEVSGGRFQFGIGVAHGPSHVRMGVTVGKPLGDIRAFVARYRSFDTIGALPPVILATLRRRMI